MIVEYRSQANGPMVNCYTVHGKCPYVQFHLPIIYPSAYHVDIYLHSNECINNDDRMVANTQVHLAMVYLKVIHRIETVGIIQQEMIFCTMW
jgi:hypothetical protein